MDAAVAPLSVEEAAHLLYKGVRSAEEVLGTLHVRAGMRALPSKDDLLELARKASPDPAILTEYPPFFGGAEISNSNPDGYNTRMHKSSLMNYAADAEVGVAFLVGHARTGVPVGYSLTGKYTGGQNERTESAFYIPSGMEVRDSIGVVNTNTVINPMRAGTLRDISIGFRGGEYRCSLCGGDMLDWFGDCFHFPGRKYVQTEDGAGKKIWRRAKEGEEGETAYAWIHNARLSEYSGVFDGATPDAMLTGIRALREVEAGHMSVETARMIEAQYRVNIVGQRRWPSGFSPLPGAEQMTRQNGEQTEREQGTGTGQEQAAGTGSETGATEAASAGTNTAGTEGEQAAPAAGTEPAGTEAARAAVPQGTVMAVFPPSALRIAQEIGVPAEHQGSVEASMRWVAEELGRLRPLATDGQTYRSDLITDTLKQAARAFGADFAKSEASYRQTLEASSIDTIKRFQTDFRAAGDARLGAGGRVTEDTSESAAATGANGDGVVRDAKGRRVLPGLFKS